MGRRGGLGGLRGCALHTREGFNLCLAALVARTPRQMGLYSCRAAHACGRNWLTFDITFQLDSYYQNLGEQHDRTWAWRPATSDVDRKLHGFRRAVDCPQAGLPGWTQERRH